MHWSQHGLYTYHEATSPWKHFDPACDLLRSSALLRVHPFFSGLRGSLPPLHLKQRYPQPLAALRHRRGNNPYLQLHPVSSNPSRMLLLVLSVLYTPRHSSPTSAKPFPSLLLRPHPQNLPASNVMFAYIILLAIPFNDSLQTSIADMPLRAPLFLQILLPRSSFYCLPSHRSAERAFD
ncbi:hypothetical protein BGZ57DRAFT_144873 [Hyaloscypha finlandica]|nr:hypothetical protein BGZ57DRAFT_144873 [Hyaloscypha finlandica]